MTTTTTATCKPYYILSGGGTQGTWEKVETTERGIKQRLAKERCGGDRWAKAFCDVYETAENGWAGTEIESGELRSIPVDVIESEIAEKRSR